MARVTQKILDNLYKKRDENSKKYDFGYLLIIGGSEYYAGAPALSALAAMRAGADMTRILAPDGASDIIAGFSPNLAVLPLKGTYIGADHLDQLIEETASVKAVSRGACAALIGGGIGRSPDTLDCVAGYLSGLDIPAVVDAEAIHALQKNPSVVNGKPFLLTPHAYEFFVMTGKKLDGLDQDGRAKAALEAAAALKTTILLKGKVDIITDGEKVAFNTTGNALMTKGGLGDTLAGVAGAYLARGANPFEAGCAAAYLNGKAGEIAGKRYGEGLLATDLIEQIPGILPKNTY